MAERKFLFMAADGYQEEGATSDSTTLGALTMGGDIDMNSAGKVKGANAATTDGDLLSYGQSGANLAGLAIDTADLTMNGRKITGLDDGTAAGDGVNKGQLDQAVITGGTIKEALFSEDQLDDAEGILSLSALFMDNNPVEDDYIEITDGTITRQYEFGTGLTTGDVLVAIGGTPAITMQNLVDAINGDGTAVWTSELNVNHDDINANVVEVWEDDNDGVASKIYGVWATQADIQYVDFTGEIQYIKNTTVDLPVSAPGSTNFGFRRTQASLTDGEMHYILGYDTIWAWDGDGTTWVPMSGSASIPDATGASGGATKGKVTIDTDFGLAINTGILKMDVTADKGLQFNSGALEIELDDSPDTLDADADGLKVVGLPSLFKLNDTAVGATVTAANLDDLTDGSNADSLHDHTNSSVSVTHASTTGKTVNDHHNQAHVLDGGDHTVSGLTTGDVLTATGAATFAFQAPGASQEAARVENALVAVENVSKADPLYHSSTADKFGKADAGTDAKAYVFGVAKADILADATGEVVSYGPAEGVLSGATAGAKYYLQDSGGIGTSPPGAAKRVIMIGWAMNADDLWVQPIDYGKKAA
jgi:hypothetical protein